MGRDTLGQQVGSVWQGSRKERQEKGRGLLDGISTRYRGAGRRICCSGIRRFWRRGAFSGRCWGLTRQ